MHDNLHPLLSVPDLYDTYAGALLVACYSLTRDKAIAEQALSNTFSHFSLEVSSRNRGHPFGKLYRQARKECLSLMDKKPAYHFLPAPALNRVVAELICTRGYSVADTAKLLNRGLKEIESILNSISKEISAEEAVV